MTNCKWKALMLLPLFVICFTLQSAAQGSGLASEGTIRGKVVAPAGLKVTVRADDMKTGMSYKTTVEESGDFELAVPVGNYTVLADAPECPLVGSGVVTVKSGRATVLNNITLVKGGSITGGISSSYRDDHILVFALKRGKFGGWEAWIYRTQADEAGHYTIGRLPAGTYDMAIISTGSGVSCFVPRYQDNPARNTAVKAVLQSRLDEHTRANAEDDVEKSLSLYSTDFVTAAGKGLEQIRQKALQDKQNRLDTSSPQPRPKGTLTLEVRRCTADDERAISVVSRASRDEAGNVTYANHSELFFWKRENGDWKLTFWNPEPPIPLYRAEMEWNFSGISEPSKRPKSFVPKIIFSREMTGIVVKAGEATSGVDYQLQ